MNENNAPMKAASLMYMLVAIIVLWNAINTVNYVTQMFELTAYTYHISTVILVAFLFVFFLYMVYNGLIAESLIAIVVIMTMGSYSIASLLNYGTTEQAFNLIAILTGLIPAIVIGLNKRNIALAVACVLTMMGLYLNFEFEDTEMIIKAVIMTVAGTIYGFYSGYLMYNILRGSDVERNKHRALNATAMCETIGYIMLASSIIYCITITNLRSIDDKQLSIVILLMSVFIAMVIAIYAAVNGSISSGTTILTISALLFLIGSTCNDDTINISPIVCGMIIFPLFFTAYRFHRKNDSLLVAISLLSIVCIALRCAYQYHDNDLLNLVTSAAMVIDAILMFYAGFARTLYVETGERKIPLFDGGSFVNQEEPWNRRFQPRPKDKDNSVAIQTYLMASIGLLLLGFHLLNNVYEFWDVDKLLFHYVLVIVSAFIILFSMENLIKGRLTETIGAIFIGVFLLSYALTGIFDVEHLSKQDILPAFCILVCGIVFFLHREYMMGVAFVATTIAMLIGIVYEGDIALVIGAVLLLAAGTLIMVKYQIRKMIKKVPNPTITERGGATDDVNLARLARTLGVLILGLVLVIIAFENEKSAKFLMMTTILTAISSFMSIYGMMKDDSPGFMFIFGTSVMIFVASVCSIATENVNYDMIAAIFMWIMIPLILVYLKRRKRVSAVIASVMFIALIAYVFTDWSTITSALFFIAGMMLCVLALGNWLVHEGILGQDVKDRVSRILG